MQQAVRAPGVQVQPDSQSEPRQAAAAGSLCYSGSKCFKVNKSYDWPFPSVPLTQGAFTACSRVSELDVFTQAAEVKVDPDKPLEGVRLAVLQVALWRKTTDPVSQHIMSYFQLSAVNSICLVYLTILVLHLFVTTCSSQAGKILLVPTPRLRTGLFNKIIPPQGANKQQLHICASSQVSVSFVSLCTQV